MTSVHFIVRLLPLGAAIADHPFPNRLSLTLFSVTPTVCILELTTTMKTLELSYFPLAWQFHPQHPVPNTPSICAHVQTIQTISFSAPSHHTAYSHDMLTDRKGKGTDVIGRTLLLYQPRWQNDAQFGVIFSAQEL